MKKDIDIRELLMNEEGTVTIDEALREARRRWPES